MPDRCHRPAVARRRTAGVEAGLGTGAPVANRVAGRAGVWGATVAARRGAQPQWQELERASMVPGVRVHERATTFQWSYLKNVLVRIDPKDAGVHVVGRVEPPGRPIFVGN